MLHIDVIVAFIARLWMLQDTYCSITLASVMLQDMYCSINVMCHECYNRCLCVAFNGQCDATIDVIIAFMANGHECYKNVYVFSTCHECYNNVLWTHWRWLLAFMASVHNMSLLLAIMSCVHTGHECYKNVIVAFMTLCHECYKNVLCVSTCHNNCWTHRCL